MRGKERGGKEWKGKEKVNEGEQTGKKRGGEEQDKIYYCLLSLGTVGSVSNLSSHTESTGFYQISSNEPVQYLDGWPF